MKNQRGFSTLLSVILVLIVLVVVAGGYLYWKTTPTQQTKEISQAVVSVITPEGTPSVVQSVQEKVVEHTSQAVLNSLDQQRQAGNNQRIQSQLGSFRAQAEVYYGNQNPSSFGIPVTGTAGCSKSGSMFASNVYTGNTNYKPLLDPSDYPSGIELTCNVSADGQAYAVEASLLGGGYWCVDSSNHLTSSGQSKAESAPLGTQTKCQ